MRQIWKLVRVFMTMFIHATALTIAVRSVPPSEREVFRAKRLSRGCKALCRVLGISVQVEGMLPAEAASLAVCNHLGVLDPFILGSRIPVSFAAKSELAGRPFIGWVLREMGVIFVERGRPHLTGQFVDAVRAKRAAGVLVLVFPEGTTTGSHHLLPFRTGAFASVEKEPEATILPLRLEPNSMNGMPGDLRSRRVLKWGEESFGAHIWQILSLRELEILLRIGEPISVGERNRKELARILHDEVHALGQLMT